MTKEQVYDEQVNPLMAEVISICKEHEIAFLASFALGFDPDGDDPDNQILCTSTGLDKQREPPEVFLKMVDMIYKRPMWAAITIHKDEVKE